MLSTKSKINNEIASLHWRNSIKLILNEMIANEYNCAATCAAVVDATHECIQ